MIDAEGYRANVAIVIANNKKQVLWAKRIGQDAWQFPQGGIAAEESPEEALYRELEEETGLHKEHVRLIARTEDWLKYDLPKKYIRNDRKRTCIGQKQIWFLLQLTASENNIKLDQSHPAEFDDWCWTQYWSPAEQVINFKRDVYRAALKQLEPHLDKIQAV